jgi:anti-sigma regulatory factor (Ser/Thr protein kinase)
LGDGEVRLEVPASPEFLRLARITAAGVASRLGFSYDEVEDLRIAIDELCYSLVGSRGRSGKVSLRYYMLPDGLAVEGTGRFDDGFERDPALSPLSRQILHAVTDECGLSATPEGPVFRILKRHPRA